MSLLDVFRAMADSEHNKEGGRRQASLVALVGTPSCYSTSATFPTVSPTASAGWSAGRAYVNDRDGQSTHRLWSTGSASSTTSDYGVIVRASKPAGARRGPGRRAVHLHCGGTRLAQPAITPSRYRTNSCLSGLSLWMSIPARAQVSGGVYRLMASLVSIQSCEFALDRVWHKR